MIEALIADPLERMEAIEALHELGFRQNSRALFDNANIEAIEPLWVAEQCARFGRKQDALAFYRNAISCTPQENFPLLLAGFADLGALSEIEEVERLVSL